MPYFESAHRCLLAALAGAALAVIVMPASALADAYGELGHFGSAGTGHGQFKITSGTHAFGVETADNSVYVGDETKKGEYRIQKLTAGGTFLAQTAPFKTPNHAGIEGIAIDTAERRLYVLALEKRGEALTIDPSRPAAGTLYAFSTEPTGEASLVAAGGTSEGVLAGPSTFEPQSDAPEVALLEPKGITVDPTTHDVIILGEVDQATPEEDEPHTRVVLERIHASGTVGARYLDSTEFFGPTATPNSPVVSAAGAVYVAVQQPQNNELTGASVDELAQIPSDFASTAPPSLFAQLTTKGTFEGEEQPVVDFDSNEPAKSGDGLSLAPGENGGEGAIYARAHIFVRAGGKGAFYPGVLAFNEADGSELGWTGGQTKLSGGESCAIGFAGETYPSVAAGGKHEVFMLDPKSAHVVELGPEGKGCPPAEASEPEATVNGQPLSEAVSTGTAVTFSSTMTQANALSVEWSFGDGQTLTVSTDEYQHTTVSHAFVQGGELTVTETIHTDDLATPTIVKQTKILVSAVALPPTAVLEGPSEVILGGGATLGRLVYLEGGGLGLEEAAPSEEAVFDASASYASTATGPNSIETYHWVFGDGKSEATKSATVRHKYEETGAYPVELTVTDAHGATSEPSRLSVRVTRSPPKPPTEVSTPTGAPSAASTEAPAATGNGSAPPASAPSPPAMPDARLARTLLAVSSSGSIDLAVTCSSGENSCAGTVTLRTLSAVSAGAPGGSRAGAKKRKASVLILAHGTFTVAGGHQKTVKLRLTGKARALLARAHALRARAIIAAHDPTGTTHTTQTTVTLHALKTHRRGAL